MGQLWAIMPNEIISKIYDIQPLKSNVGFLYFLDGINATDNYQIVKGALKADQNFLINNTLFGKKND